MGLALQGPIFATTTDDIWLQEGDSISALDTDTQMPALIKRRYINACYLAGVQPRWINTAISNTGINLSLARVQASVPKYQPTKFLAVYGTASIILGQAIGTVNDTTSATVLGSLKLVLDIVCTQSGIQAYIGGPAFVGEKWPTGIGANALDANIDLLNAGMITICARYPLCTYRDLRAALFTVGEPVDNPANVSLGPYSRPDGVFAHHNPAGRGKSDTIIVNDFTVTTAPAAALGTAVYSGSTPPSPTVLGVDYEATNSKVADGVNITTVINTGVLGSAADLTVTPGTKPVMRAPAQAGKLNGAAGIDFGGATWMRSANFTAQNGPYLTAIVWKSVNLTASQILYDGINTIQEGSLATLLTSGITQTNSGATFNGPAVVAGNWNYAINYYANNRAGSYSVVNGVSTSMADAGANFTRSRMTLGAAAGASLIATIVVGRFMEYYSSLGTLPRWQDVAGYLTTKYGSMPQ